MVTVGIIGFGPHWDSHYRPVLDKLKTQVRLRSVFNTVAGRAEQVAAETGCVCVSGVLALSLRPDVQAVLLLDLGWYGWEALKLVARSGKPTFLAGPLTDDVTMLRQLHGQALAQGMLVTPELRQRYTPASARLQELMATEIGHPLKIEMTVRANGNSTGHDSPGEPPEGQQPLEGRVELIEALDWCQYMARSHAARIEAVRSANGRTALRIGFRPPKSGGQAVQALLGAERSSAASHTGPQIDVECVHGRAAIRSTTNISWQPESTADWTDEVLTADRSEFEVMLDHFFRRVAGGLIPVADLNDVYRSAELLIAARESSTSGRAIELTTP